MKNSTIKKVLRWAAILLASVVFVFNVTVAIASIAGAYGRWDIIPGAFLSVQSGSMEPDISTGDMIFAWNVPYGELAVGDDVVFAANGELITHRIIGIGNNEITTRGIANKFNDAPFSEDAYCGKVIFAVPGGAWLVEFITSLPGVILYFILVFVICYGYPLFRYITDRIEKSKSGAEAVKLGRPGTLRIATSLCLASLILLTPLTTSSKYTAKLNEFSSMSSLETNFTSNYLSEGGHDYSIQGWGGLSYTVDITLRNLTNDLKYNKADVDVTYRFTVEKVESEGVATYNTADYEIAVTPDSVTTDDLDSERTDADANGMTWYTLHGSDDRSDLKTHSFQVVISSTKTDGQDAVALDPNTVICFKITAETTDDTGYYRMLEGKFVLRVAADSSFIGQTQLNSSAGSSLVSYSVTTNTVYGQGTRDIIIEWNPTKLSLNTYEPTAFNVILKDPTRHQPSYVDPETPDAPAVGRLTVALQGYSRVEFQFFKLKANDTIEEDVDISVREADNSADGD